MQIVKGQRYHSGNDFPTLIDMLRQSEKSYADRPAFRSLAKTLPEIRWFTGTTR